LEILEKTLEQAKKARLEILAEMEKAIAVPRPNLSPYAPRILSLMIDPEKIGMVIGPQGKMINEIIEQTGASSIDIDDSGQVYITGKDGQSAERAFAWIKDMTREPKEGEIYQGKVVKITDFGAFVQILPNKDGLVHISELANYHVKRVEDVVKLGDIIPVKIKGIDETGRISLTLKNAK
jgi:polyribonucleotide nucleotidyltransferase